MGKGPTPIISAREAAQRFGVGKDTCRRLAAVAHEAGDPDIHQTRKGWYAAEAWWQKALSEPQRRGRPRRHVLPEVPEPEPAEPFAEGGACL